MFANWTYLCYTFIINCQFEKREIIVFNKQVASGHAMQELLISNKDSKLSDGNCELYGESWSIRRRSENEDEL